MGGGDPKPGFYGPSQKRKGACKRSKKGPGGEQGIFINGAGSGTFLLWRPQGDIPTRGQIFF